MKIQVFESFSNDLEDQWKKIEKNSNFNPFLSYEWIKLWQSEIGSKLLKVKPKIILIENKQNEKAIFPFCIKHQNSIKICEWMGDINSDYMGFISTRKFNLGESKFQEILEVILERIGNIDVLYLKNQLPKINDFANPFYNLRSIYKKKAYLSFLNKNWEEYYKFHQNSKSRETYRRKLKKIQKIGSLSFIVAKTEEQKLKIIKQMIELKKKRYLSTSAWNMFSKKEYQNFYMNLNKIKSDHINIHCSEVKIDNNVIANHVGIYSKDCFYYLMPAFENKKWSIFSPGVINLIELIKWSINNRINCFDFTTGDENYKTHWFDKEIEIRDNIQIFSFKGFLFLNYITFKMKLKKNTIFKNLKKRFNYIINY